MDTIYLGGDGATALIGPEPMLPPTRVDGTITGKILKEIGKQAIDQAGHFLIGAGPIWLSRQLVGMPWYGWVVTPVLAYREWLQWPSNRWWDPPLDWAFLSLGVVTATWSRGVARILGGLAQSIRQARQSHWLRVAWRGKATADPIQAHPAGAPGQHSLSATAEAESRR